MKQDLYLPEKSFLSGWEKSKELVKLQFLKTVVVLLISVFVVIAVRAQVVPAATIDIPQENSIEHAGHEMYRAGDYQN